MLHERSAYFISSQNILTWKPSLRRRGDPARSGACSAPAYCDPRARCRDNARGDGGKATSKRSIVYGVVLRKRARALLRWEQRDLANASSVSLPTIKRLESRPGILAAHGSTLAALRKAIESAGAEFLRRRSHEAASHTGFAQSSVLEGLRDASGLAAPLRRFLSSCLVSNCRRSPGQPWVRQRGLPS